jgi:hypothetical protein
VRNDPRQSAQATMSKAKCAAVIKAKKVRKDALGKVRKDAQGKVCKVQRLMADETLYK